MPPAKKVAVTVYVPAGPYCEGYTFKCPFLLDGHVGCFCVLIPEAIWLSHGYIKKHAKCPSLLVKGNKLTQQDVVNHRLRIVKKAAKEHRFGEFKYGDENGEEYTI